MAIKWVGSSLPCMQSLQVEEPTSRSPFLFRKRAASVSRPWYPKRNRTLKFVLLVRCSRSLLCVIVQIGEGVPGRWFICVRRCTWRLHLRSASSSRFAFALARMMSDTTLFHTDLDGACCRRSLAEGRLRESEDARMEGSHALAFGACNLSNRTWRGQEASAQGVIQWSERKVASFIVVTRSAIDKAPITASRPELGQRNGRP